VSAQSGGTAQTVRLPGYPGLLDGETGAVPRGGLRHFSQIDSTG
jgi:hypothetical protein